MNNPNNNPARIYSEYMTAVEAYEMEGPKAQALWMEGYQAAKAARTSNAIQSAALVMAATCTIFTAIFLTF